MRRTISFVSFSFWRAVRLGFRPKQPAPQPDSVGAGWPLRALDDLIGTGTIAGPPAANGLRTVLQFQRVLNQRYFDAAGFPGRTVGLPETVKAGAR